MSLNTITDYRLPNTPPLPERLIRGAVGLLSRLPDSLIAFVGPLLHRRRVLEVGARPRSRAWPLTS